MILREVAIVPVICPTRLSKNSFARERGRNFLLFVSQIAEKFLPPVQHKPSEETVFYALERRTNSCSASTCQMCQRE
jgi:hypothetical protein